MTREIEEEHQLRFPNHLNLLSWVAVTQQNDKFEMKKPIAIMQNAAKRITNDALTKGSEDLMLSLV